MGRWSGGSGGWEMGSGEGMGVGVGWKFEFEGVVWCGYELVSDNVSLDVHIIIYFPMS